MAGVVADFRLDSAEAEAALARLSDADLSVLTDRIGQLIEVQTRERIATGKVSPDGMPWAEWSPDYAKTRSARHSLLIGGGQTGLYDTIQNYSTADMARVGTELAYGAIHQFGGADAGKPGIPARPYLGLSIDNRRAVEELVVGDLERILQ